MAQSNFREWTLDKIDEAFGTKPVRQLPSLDEWLAHEHQITDYERTFLNDLRELYHFLGGEDWNEAELENKIISPLFVFAKVNTERFSYFLERELSATIGDWELSGKVDGMIASGFRNPKKPYFCMNEYKRATDPTGDPKGQALIAMLAAQQVNDNNLPVYGCYIVGRQWCFMALEGSQYAFSNAYTCDDEEIFEIFRILRGLRKQVEKAIR